MKTYQYQVVKYVHDHFTGEYVNMGIVLYDPDSQYLNCKVTDHYNRIESMFQGAKGTQVIKVLQEFRNRILRKKDEIGNHPKSGLQLNVLTETVLPKDASVIQISAAQRGLDVDLDAALDQLFYQLVEKYT